MWKIAGVLCCLLIAVSPLGEAKKKEPEPPCIIYIPHDNRPISEKQTAAVVGKLGYKVLVPPDELLGNRTDLGHPDELWEWLRKNAEGADAAVVSSDSMLYGSLVGSRKHVYKETEIAKRTNNFLEFRKMFPKLPLYVFGSIMRTPRSGAASGHEEPPYYRAYGADIFRYTGLNDKQEMEGLTHREKKEQAFLEKLVPKPNLQDWMGRRKKNYESNKKLLDLVRKNTFNFLVIGRDDNAPCSQTHMESRHLKEYGKDLGEASYINAAGIDEIGMLLLARAVNDMKKSTPYVFVRYNWGKGPYTVPAYSDEPLSESVDDAITISGCMQTNSPEIADLVLTVNSNPSGETYEGATWSNDGKVREGTEYFVQIVEDYLKKGYPVGIADVAFANGADNALIEQLRNKDLLFRLQSYSGWNTPTNSTGFAIGEGVLAKNMKREDIDELLLTRYMDDWAYQANVRNVMARQLSWLRGDGVYGNLDEKRSAVMNRTERLMKTFLEQNFPRMDKLSEIQVIFPWNRMFEADIQYGRQVNWLK